MCGILNPKNYLGINLGNCISSKSHKLLKETIGSDSHCHRSKYTHLKLWVISNFFILKKKKKKEKEKQEEAMSTISIWQCMLTDMLGKYGSFFIYNL